MLDMPGPFDTYQDPGSIRDAHEERRSALKTPQLEMRTVEKAFALCGLHGFGHRCDWPDGPARKIDTRQRLFNLRRAKTT